MDKRTDRFINGANNTEKPYGKMRERYAAKSKDFSTLHSAHIVLQYIDPQVRAGTKPDFLTGCDEIRQLLNLLAPLLYCSENTIRRQKSVPYRVYDIVFVYLRFFEITVTRFTLDKRTGKCIHGATNTEQNQRNNVHKQLCFKYLLKFLFVLLNLYIFRGYKVGSMSQLWINNNNES